MRGVRGALVSGVAAAVLCVSNAHAGGRSADDARADALFDEGTRLLDQKRYSEACPKLEESRKLGPGIGVTLYLADCEDGLGHWVRALALLREAEALAIAKKDNRSSVAHTKVAELQARLPMLALRVEAPDQESAITVDDETVPSDQWGSPRPIDPGRHTVRATSKGGVVWETGFVAESKKTDSITVPSPRATVATPPVAPASTGFWTTTRIVGGVTAGVGLVLVGIGAGFGVDAISQKSASNDGHCNASDQCDPTGLALRDSGLASATVSTVFSIVGAVAVVVGVVLLAVPSSRTKKETVAFTF